MLATVSYQRSPVTGAGTVGAVAAEIIVANPVAAPVAAVTKTKPLKVFNIAVVVSNHKSPVDGEVGAEAEYVVILPVSTPTQEVPLYELRTLVTVSYQRSPVTGAGTVGAVVAEIIVADPIRAPVAAVTNDTPLYDLRIDVLVSNHKSPVAGVAGTTPL